MSIDAMGPVAAKSADGKEIPDINTDTETYFLLTSLTSGSSAIITATSRLEVLLITMKVPFVAVDIATNDKAKNLWKRRGNGKRLPVVVHDGVVIGNFEDLEQANEINSFKQTLRIPVKPDDADSITRKPSVASLDFAVSKKPSASPLPKIESEPEPAFVPTPMAQAVAKAAALAAEKRKSGAFTTASRASSIRSVRSVASSTRKHVEGPTPKVEEPAPKVEEPAPKVEEPAPKVEEPAPKVEEPAPKVEEPAPKVEEPAPKVEEPEPKIEEPVVEKPIAVVEKAPKVKETPRTVKATSSIRNRAPVPAAAKRTSVAPTAKTVAERAIKATGRASIDEKRTSISRSSSRASSLRPESRISVRPDSKAAKRTTLSGTQEKKAPSITARSVKSTSSSSTVKPTARGLNNGKKSKIDKLKKEEVK